MSKINTSKTAWDLSPLLNGDDDPNIQRYRKTVTQAADKFAKKWRGRSDYQTKPAVLKIALDELEAFRRLEGNESEYYYFHLRSAQDSINPALKAKQKQATDFVMETMNKYEFFWLNLAKIKPELHQDFLEADALEPYHHLIKKSFERARYYLSEAEEKLLTLKWTVAHDNWVTMTENFLSKEERKVLKEDGKKSLASQEEMLSLLQSQTKAVRDSANTGLEDVFLSHAETAEAEINSILANKKIDDELRGYDRPDEARHNADDIESDVVDALVKAVSDANHIARKYYRLKARLLGLPRLRYHERAITYGNVTKEYSYDEGCQLVHQVFTNLDPQFGDLFTAFLNEGRIDVYPTKGKRGGAFCAYGTIAHPVYVLLNYTNKLEDVSTLAHELGHGINDELMKRTQNSLNYSTSLSTAEVASTFMEDLVLERLAAGVDEQTKFSIMVKQLDDCIKTIFRQIAFYRFEQELHAQYRQRGYLTYQEISKLFKKNIASYMGDASEGSELWWIYVSHFRNFFYVYSYASGLLISKALQAKVRQDKTFIKKVKQFLSAGSSKSPKAIFKEMGIDITDDSFWQDGIAEIEQLLSDTEALAKKLAKI